MAEMSFFPSEMYEFAPFTKKMSERFVIKDLWTIFAVVKNKNNKLQI